MAKGEHVIRQASLLGRVGTELGKGLAESIPKESERYRLSQGLEQLGKQQDLSPFQQFSRLAAIPGVTPQMLQSGSELLRQQAQAQALSKGFGGENQEPPSFPKINQIPEDVNAPKKSQSITTKGPVQATIENYIPKTYPEILDRADQLFKANPALYKNESNNAIAAAQQEDQSNQAVNAAQQAQRKGQQDVQSRVTGELQSLAQRSGGIVPDNVYKKLEKKAIDEVRTGEKTERQAAEDARDEYDSISRDFKTVDSFGDLTFMLSNPKSIMSSIKSIRKKAKEGGYQEDLADYMVARNGFSNEFAHYLANPPEGDVGKIINELPVLRTRAPVKGIGLAGNKIDIGKKTQEVIEKLVSKMNKDDSPLAIANQLREKGYDSQLWKDYIIDHQDKLNISKSQIRELEKVDKANQGWLNGTYFKIFGGA